MNPICVNIEIIVILNTTSFAASTSYQVYTKLWGFYPIQIIQFVNMAIKFANCRFQLLVLFNKTIRVFMAKKAIVLFNGKVRYFKENNFYTLESCIV